MRGEVLLFDADDTLWMNLALFEQVVQDYFDWISHPTLDRVALRQILDDIERATIAERGYGTLSFLHSLGRCFEQLQQRTATDQDLADIDRLATALINFEVRLLPGVAETLDELATRHEMFLVTKGHPDEQQRKIDASGLADHFRAVHIVAEKDPDTYRAVVAQHGLDPAHSWMIGNSPRSDIMPARAAGLNAVFIPHEITWSLEHVEIDPDDRHVLTLTSITELTRHF